MLALRRGSFLIVLLSLVTSQVCAQYWLHPNLDWKLHTAGNVLRVVLNSSFEEPRYEYTSPLDYGTFMYKGPWSTYPKSSQMEHGSTSQKPSFGGICRHDGRIDTLYTGASVDGFYPYELPWDTVWVVKNHATVDIPYWPGYQGLSDEDFICRYHSNQRVVTYWMETGRFTRHIPFPPLYVDVIERSLTWSFPPLQDLVVYIYKFIPTRYDYTQFYAGIEEVGSLWLDNVDLGGAASDSSVRAQYYPDRHLVGWLPNQIRGWPHRTDHWGFQVFAEPKGSPLRWTMNGNWFEFVDLQKSPDSTFPPGFYKRLSSGNINFPGREYSAGAFIAVGPYDLPVGDTLTIVVGEIYAQSTPELLWKSTILEKLYQQGFRAPVPPPAPKVRFEKTDKSVTLHWDPLPGEVNPETYQDANRGDSMKVPFEGYRLYKSTVSASGPWTFLNEYDIPNNGFAHDIGLRYDYTDAPLLPGFYYYYAVTAFSKKDTVIGFPSTETPQTASVVRIAPSNPPPQSVGEVAVIPNPYRGDVNYNGYTPSWEQPSGKWTYWVENDRRITFIHLPAHCEIKIYTLAGDVINTLRHDDPVNTFENWNLTSSVSQAVASGLYLYTVEDKQTGRVQAGKFVIIK